MTELVLAVRHAATNVTIIACRCKHNCIRKEPLCIYPCQNNFDRSKCVQSGTALPINIKRYCISSHKYQSYYDSHIRWEIWYSHSKVSKSKMTILSHAFQVFFRKTTKRNGRKFINAIKILLICFSFLKWCVFTVYQARSFKESWLSSLPCNLSF